MSNNLEYRIANKLEQYSAEIGRIGLEVAQHGWIITPELNQRLQYTRHQYALDIIRMVKESNAISQ